MTMDPYQTLGVSRTASQDEIKNAYRGLAKKFHPDLNPGRKEAERKFKDVNAAYELIGKPDNRAKYDRGETEGGIQDGSTQRRGPFYYETQRPGATTGASSGRYTYSFGEDGDEDLFASIFGERGRARAQRQTRGEDQLYQMEIDLRDAVTGAEKEITLPGNKRLSVRIPAGITEGTRLRFAGQGDPAPAGGEAGDAYVEIRIRADERFKLERDQLVFESPVSVDIAVLGGELRVPTPEGVVMVRVPPRSNTGTRLRLPGKGLFNRATGRRGDELVVLKITIPESLYAPLEEALRAGQRKGAA